jgi:hypothetical protein
MLKKWGVRAWIGYSWLKTGSYGATCENVNEPLGLVKANKLLAQPSDY